MAAGRTVGAAAIVAGPVPWSWHTHEWHDWPAPRPAQSKSTLSRPTPNVKRNRST